MIKTMKRVSPTSSVSSYSNASTAPFSTASSLLSPSTSSVSQLPTPNLTSNSQPNAMDCRFQHLEARIDSSAARMDSIEQLCRQLKTNTDVTSQNIQQLAADFYSTRPSSNVCRSPASKSQRLSDN
jgi:hypothetical protein